MIPDYLRDEIVLRLASARLSARKLKAICRLLEIDLDAAINPGPTREEVVEDLLWREMPPFSGAVPFHFRFAVEITSAKFRDASSMRRLALTRSERSSERRAPARRSYGTPGNRRSNVSRCLRTPFRVGSWNA